MRDKNTISKTKSGHSANQIECQRALCSGTTGVGPPEEGSQRVKNLVRRYVWLKMWRGHYIRHICSTLQFFKFRQGDVYMVSSSMGGGGRVAASETLNVRSMRKSWQGFGGSKTASECGTSFWDNPKVRESLKCGVILKTLKYLSHKYVTTLTQFKFVTISMYWD